MITIKKPIAKLHKSETRLGLEVKKKTAVKAKKIESVFIQMHNGTRHNEGSFNQGLKNLFYAADRSNKIKLVKAFPEFFGRSVPEFGIYPYKRAKK